MKRYHVSKYFWFVFSAITFSLFLILFSLIDMALFKHPTKLNDSNVRKLRENSYVELKVERILMGENGYPIRGAYMSPSGMGENVRYTVAVGENTYIEMSFGEKESIQLLEGFSGGTGTGFTVRGRVSDVAIDQDIYQWSIPGFDLENLIPDKRIIETSEKSVGGYFKAKLLFAGAILVVAGLLCFTGIGICPVDEPLFEETKQYKKLLAERNYNLEGDLEKAQNRKEELRQKQGKNTKWIWIGIVMALFGGHTYLYLATHYAEIGGSPWIILLMLVLFFCGIRTFWRAVLNSQWPPALKIATKFTLNTIPVQIEETSKIIGILRRRLAEQEKSAEVSTDPETTEIFSGDMSFLP